MKKLIISLLLIYVCQLAAGLSDYENEFGFPMDKPRHGKYYFMRELLSIDHDPQIMTYMPDENIDLRQNLINNQTTITDLDQIELSDSTLILDVDAVNDLDMFTSLKMHHQLDEYANINIINSNYQLRDTEPADYNLYTRMDIPLMFAKDTHPITFFPITEESKQALRMVIPKINDFSYQIDNIYLKENRIYPQNGSIEFTLIIGVTGIENVDYTLSQNSRFSQSFIRKASDAIMRWQITSPVKIQYSFSRHYLNRP